MSTTTATFRFFQHNPLNQTAFTGTIKAKAVCLRPVPKPKPAETTKNKGLGTLFIVFIVTGSFVFLCLCFFAVYSWVKKRKRSILDDEMNEDYGTYSEPPSVHVQNASSPPDQSKPL